MKFAFLIHPISEGTSTLIDLDLGARLKSAWGQDSLLFCAKFHETVKQSRAAASSPASASSPAVRVVDEMRGIVSELNAEATGRLYEIPLAPGQFIDHPRMAVEMMGEAVSMARDWGAELVGLGGLTGIVGGQGVQMAESAGIGITTGNSLTVYSTVECLRNLCDELGLDLSQESVAVVGIPGSIATATARIVAESVGRLILVARRDSTRARKLAKSLDAELILEIPSALEQTGLVITATSSGGCLDQKWLQPGSVVIDVGVPTDVQGSSRERNDVMILSGGQTRIPSSIALDSRFLWFNQGVIPSCLGETMVLAFEGRPDSLSLGRNLDPSDILSVGALASAHGFDFSLFRSFGLELEDTELVRMRKRLARTRMNEALSSVRRAESSASDSSQTAEPNRRRATSNGNGTGSEAGTLRHVSANNPQRSLENMAPNARQKFGRYLNPVLMELTESTDFSKTFVRGEGAYLYDCDGMRYLDFVSGFGSVNLGHNHPNVVSAIEQALREKAPGFSQASVNPLATSLAEQLVSFAPESLEMVFFTNSGTESVEAALKLARTATGRSGFVYCQRSYHGKSLGSLSVTGNSDYQRPFRPLLTECRAVPFGDLDSLEHELRSRRHAAFIVEPIQAEGGMIVPDRDYLSRAHTLCQRYDTLLIVDEVQTGFGRTGRMFAVDEQSIHPDIMTVAKSLGGGAIPIGAMLCRRDLWTKVYGTVQTYLLHTSTFGGGSLACAAGLATLDTLQNGELIRNAQERGDELKAGLDRLCRARRSLREVRGCGLLLGLEFNPMSAAAQGHWKQMAQTRLTRRLVPGLDKMLETMSALYTMQTLLSEHRIYTQVTRSNPLVMRVQPPLLISSEQVNTFIDAVDACCDEMEFQRTTIRDVLAKTGTGRHNAKGQSADDKSPSIREDAEGHPLAAQRPATK